MYLTCPICQSPLSLLDRSYKCESNHSYDLAKDGYINLLPVQHKNSKNPGDNKEMINARRAFLSAGHYDPLIQSILSIIDEPLNKTLLDSGCGEGYYSAYIAKHLQNLNVIGFDISKVAIQKAAKKYKDHQYFVGSVNKIPLMENSMDYILTVFAPIEVSQFDKVLSNDGKVVIVSAGPNHMKEVAELIYDKFNPHSYNPNNSLSSIFKIEEDENVTFNIAMTDKDDILNLLKMTPYYWSADEKSRSQLIRLPNLDVTCDFRVQSFVKRKKNT